MHFDDSILCVIFDFTNKNNILQINSEIYLLNMAHGPW